MCPICPLPPPILLSPPPPRSSPCAVAPLFETLDDLHNAPATIDTLLSSEWYRNHITTRHEGVQECMIGEGNVFAKGCRGSGLRKAWV